MKIDFGARRQTDQVVAFGSALSQFAIRVRDQQCPVTKLAQSEYCQQDLALPASPRSRGIDVD